MRALKYYAVSFMGTNKAYTYSFRKRLKKGDYVIVPTGAQNIKEIGRVHNTYPADHKESMFIKEIISVIDVDEVCRCNG